VFHVKLLGAPLESRKLGAVLLATAGVLAVVYGGSQAGGSDEEISTDLVSPHSSAPLAGDLLTLIASVIYGLYQVLYKKYATLSAPDGHEDLPQDALYQAIPPEAGDVEARRISFHNPDAAYPLPFGFFANFLTGAVGLCTLVVLGAFVPILDMLGIEEFRPVPDLHTAVAIATIGLSGMVFNAGFMVSARDYMFCA
jgi:drug/metabolite transporter (DMT)-like permease